MMKCSRCGGWKKADYFEPGHKRCRACENKDAEDDRCARELFSADLRQVGEVIFGICAKHQKSLPVAMVNQIQEDLREHLTKGEELDLLGVTVQSS